MICFWGAICPYFDCMHKKYARISFDNFKLQEIKIVSVGVRSTSLVLWIVNMATLIFLCNFFLLLFIRQKKAPKPYIKYKSGVSCLRLYVLFLSLCWFSLKICIFVCFVWLFIGLDIYFVHSVIRSIFRFALLLSWCCFWLGFVPPRVPTNACKYDIRMKHEAPKRGGGGGSSESRRKIQETEKEKW